MLTEMYHRAKFPFMNEEINKKRVERIMTALKCKNANELVTQINRKGTVIYASIVSRWIKRGMYKSTGALIDLLLERIEILERKNG